MLETLILPKTDCEHLLGQFLDASHYDLLIDSDTDVYQQEPIGDGITLTSEANIILKFRKGWFSLAEQEGAYAGMRDAAAPTQNRGLAAGTRVEKCGNREWVTAYQIEVLTRLAELPDNDIFRVTPHDIDQWRRIAETKSGGESRGLVWLASERDKHGFTFDKWLDTIYIKPNVTIKSEVEGIHNTFISDTTYANRVLSGIAGWFGRYPRYPYGRATSYTAKHPDQFALAYPYLQSLANGFDRLLPERSAKQWVAAASLDPAFTVPGTPFTTITVNLNFRTAAHRDAGDLARGFSNLAVVTDGKHDYTGGYLILPEIRAAVNVRPGDLLLVANHDYIHGNTPIEGDNPERLSLVCYFREDMLELGSAKYEALRQRFVEERIRNPDHPDRKGPLWNGVTSEMWTSDEWRDYILANDPESMKYHPEFATATTLDNLFE